MTFKKSRIQFKINLHTNNQKNLNIWKRKRQSTHTYLRMTWILELSDIYFKVSILILTMLQKGRVNNLKKKKGRKL